MSNLWFVIFMILVNSAFCAKYIIGEVIDGGKE